MRQICDNKNKIRWWKTERPHAVAHLMAYSFSSFQCQRPDWKALFFLSPLTSHLLPPTLSSRHRLLASSAISLFIFKEITGGSAELTFSPLFFFSILSFIVFSLSSHTVVFHLPRPSCRASGQCSVIYIYFFSSFVFAFHLHPALALLKRYHISPTTSCHLIFLSSFSSYFLTWEFHLAASLFQVTAPPPPSWKLLPPACRGKKKRRMRAKSCEQYSLITEPQPSVTPLYSHGVKWAYRRCNFNDREAEDDRDEKEWDEKLKSSSAVIDIKRWASLHSSSYHVSVNSIHNKLLFDYEQSQRSRKANVNRTEVQNNDFCVGKDRQIVTAAWKQRHDNRLKS